MCGSPEDAEEVAQETLLKVFQNIDQLREPERVRSWVFRIARNVCLMQRRQSVFAPTEELPVDEVPLPDANDLADERLLHAGTARGDRARRDGTAPHLPVGGPAARPGGLVHR